MREDAPENPIFARASSSGEDNRRKAVEALFRGLPVTRVIDYGVKREDALSLMAPVASVDAWIVRARADADDQGAAAESIFAMGDQIMAAQHLEWQAAVLNVAQLAFNADVPEKATLYRAASTAWARSGALSGEFGLQSYPLDDVAAPVWVFGQTDPIGCVVVWGGLSGWGMSYLSMARALARRGISTLLAELPGQGLARMEKGIFLARARLAALGPLLDVAAALAPRVGVMGNSFGGLLAANVAAMFPQRIAACCINGATPSIALPEHRAPREQMMAASGLGEAQLGNWLSDLDFDPQRTPLQCPVLIVEGGADPLVPVGAQAAFLTGEAASGASRVLHWPDGEHTVYNHANDRNALVSAWFFDRFNSEQARPHG